jgi:hypothetical protein
LSGSFIALTRTLPRFASARISLIVAFIRLNDAVARFSDELTARSNSHHGLRNARLSLASGSPSLIGRKMA